MKPNSFKSHFPIFQNQAMAKPALAYLDSAASAQKPKPMIDAIQSFYQSDYASVHRGVYALSENATAHYEQTRAQVSQWLGAQAASEIIFVRGTTEAINLVAHSFLKPRLEMGDEIILSEMEHHSNIVPWYLIAKEKGARIKVIPVLADGTLDLHAFKTLFSNKTKMLAISHVSNVLGTINPIKDMVDFARAQGVPSLIDGAQAVPHLKVNVSEIDCDFYCFSGHKVYAPTGVGCLYGKKKQLMKMLPYQGGGSMIVQVDFDHIEFAEPPQRFEAGTPDIAAVLGLSASLNWLHEVDYLSHYDTHQALRRYAEEKLKSIPGLILFGQADHKVGVLSFLMEGMHAHDVGTILSHENVAVRAGHHCAMPLMKRFQVPALVRASLGIYNDEQDVDALIRGLQLARSILQ